MVTACTRCRGDWPHELKISATGAPSAPVCGPCYIELRLLDMVTPGASVLDVGAGIGRYAQALYRHTNQRLTLLDAHLDTLLARILPKDLTLLVGDLRTVLPLVRDDAFDFVIAIDLIEHLEKEEGEAALQHMLRIARHKVAVFTPDGFVPQEQDNYGLGNEFQRHRSGWSQQDLLACASGTVTRLDPFHETGEAALFAVLNA